MSVFDQPFYASTKARMSRIGIWPEQSKYVRTILPLTAFAISLTLAGPMFIRLHDAWRDIAILARSLTCLLMGVSVFCIILTCTQHVGNMKFPLRNIEEHWEMFKNTPAVIVFEKYAERGRYITDVYSTLLYVVLILYFSLCLSPIILDFVDPVNETRPKIYVVEAEYGVDRDKYYWFIYAHTYIVTMMAVSMVIAVATMYILWIGHACALFEVVGFNLELIANEYMLNKEDVITLRSDRTYKKICDCIKLHAEAITFADLIEGFCSGPSGMILGIFVIIIVISGVQVLINWNHTELLIQQVLLIICQVFQLYITSIPGQELMNRSGKIHSTAYNLEWQDMSVNTRKLLIPLLIRSNKPCCLTAGKFYVLSIETFGTAMRTALSYFMIFAQMI